MWREYYRLTKPGIIYGNALTAAAGFFIGTHDQVLIAPFVVMLVGISCIIASGCVFNNYIDRDIDALMERTKNRALVKGRISLRAALVFGTALGVAGAIALIFINLLSLAVGLFGLFMYALVYSILCKRYTLHATVIGAIAGAVPPVVGYTAATNSLDLGALILFLILFTWQMPHALAIAIRRFDDYKAAGIPVMPVVMNHFAAKLQMLCYTGVFLLAVAALFFSNYTGIVFLFAMLFMGGIWLLLCVHGFWVRDDKAWAKRVFRFSLLILLAFCLLAAFNAFLP